jgi:two-component system sensor histidine kinase/response regulator
MRTRRAERTREDLLEENAALREEIRVARGAAAITCRKVVEQFVKNEEILRKLQVQVRTESELRTSLGEKLDEAERRERELAAMRERAEEATRAKSSFLANVSHELRTPMNAIIGMTALALETTLTEEQEEMLSTVQVSADALLELLDDLLDFSKVEAGRLDLEAVSFSLADIVKNALRTVSVRAHDKGLDLAGRLDPSAPPVVVGDPGRLRQVLVNLLGNAIKFTERGEVVLSVEVGEEEGERVRLRFEVRDSGIGIPEDKQEAIFDAFTQADSSTTRTHGGTGLGLAISAQLVSLMGGELAVQSSPGHGSTFRFSLSFPIGSGDELVTPLSAEGLDGIPVLIVDDHAATRSVLAELAAAWGMEPTPAEGPDEAWVALRRASADGTPFRLALLDAELPGMVAEHLAENLASVGCRVILMTSGVIGTPLRSATRTSLAGSVRKPVDPSELLALVQRLVDPGGMDLGDAEPTSPEASPLRRPGRILVAEDNPVNQRLARMILEREGHRVEVAEDGIEAYQALERTRFDLVLMDVRMPRMGGLEATAAIRRREQETGRRVPIVALTAHAMKGDRERFLRAGMDAYLSKPLRPDDLLGTIEGFLGDEALPPEDVPPAVAASTSTAEAFDPERVLAVLDGDTEVAVELVDLFLDSTRELLEELRDAVERGDGERIRRAAHSLKGSASNFHAEPAVGAAYTLERAGAENDAEVQMEALRELEAECARLRTALVDFRRRCRG